MKQVHEGTKSQFQSKIIPIPDPIYVKGSPSDNFIGRLGTLLSISDFVIIIFITIFNFCCFWLSSGKEAKNC